MRNHLLIACAVVATSCGGRAREAPTRTATLSATPQGISPYVTHARQHGRAPTDYVLELFKKHDVVILGERLHPELTQWQFIYDLVTDPRFVEQVGVIYTEYGAVNLQPRLDRYLADRNADREQLFGIMRDFGIWPTGWGNANFIEFVEKLRRFNLAQATDRRVSLQFADCFWDWRALDEHTSPTFSREVLFARDFLMAKRIEAGITLEQPSGRKKALVIMNTRHSYVIAPGTNARALDDNTGSYLRLLLAGQRLSVVSVLLNTTTFAEDGTSTLIAGGRWDAAFRALGDRPLGFDLAGSPFGEDRFDLHERYRDLRYRDVYHGMLFITPLAQQTKQELMRGYLTPEFIAEIRRRMRYAMLGRTPEETNATRQRLEKVLDIVSTPNLPPAYEDELFGARPVYRGRRLAELEQQITAWSRE